MNDIDELFAALSPDKKILLEQRLVKKNKSSGPEPLAPTNGPWPLSFAQESLWFLDQLETDSALYNVPEAIHLRGALNVEALRQSFETILQRHESLRTNFISVDGKPMQVVAENKYFNLPIADLTPFPRSEREREIECRLDRESRRPFNLAEGPMLRAGLLHLRENEHILFITLNHIAADAWSLGLLHTELAALYESFCSGKPSPLPELDFQYADFAVHQRETFQGEVAARQIDYWKERLSGELPVLELPTDRPPKLRQTFRGAVRNFKFPTTLLNALKETSCREKVTVFAFSLAAFQILLQRYSHQDDILVGCPMVTRNLRETEALIGYFVNTVVLRGDLSGNPTFQELLREINRHVLGALSHQEVPLERLVEELKVPRPSGRNPLVQVCFQYLAESPAVLDFPGLTAEFLPLDTRTSKFDLSLDLCDGPDGLLGQVEFNTDLFDPATIDRMMGHYQVLLEALVSNPAQKIAELPLLTKAEEHQLLVEWNDTAFSFPSDLSLVDLLEKQVAANPAAVAVIFENEQLTYGELNQRANQLARALKKTGVQRDELVGICMERSLEMLVAVHGVLKAGAAFFPLDPEYPEERLLYMLEDAQAPVLLCQKRFAGIALSERTQVISLDADWEMIAGESGENLESKPGPEDLAYVIYTSGSTGQPKGVMISHRSICDELFWMQSCFPLGKEDRILQKASFSFDVAVWELLAPILTSAPLVMAKPGGHRDSAYLAELIAEKEITILQAVPSALRALLEEPQFTKCTSLKYVLCGGEEMPADLPERFASISKAQLSNTYGPTEAAIDATFWICPRRSDRSVLPIGRPTANTEVYLLDAHLQPVPIGVPGELCVGGRGLARGYWRRPEFTAEKFIRHPFRQDPAARLYRTGDLARYRPDGNIEFLGRIDHQVKVRGFRIELGEIENALRACPDVREAAVIARPNASGEKHLVAYWVAAQNPAPPDGSLRTFLKTRLPDFMVPAAFVLLEALPQTPNGKLDRKALPAPDFQSASAQFAAPRTALEQQLTEIWREVLGIKQLGVHDNFFELGGHSLLATQAVSRIRSHCGQDLALRDFFQAPTVEALAAMMDKAAAENLPGMTIKPLPRNKTLISA